MSESVTSNTAGTHTGAPDNSPNSNGIVFPYIQPTTFGCQVSHKNSVTVVFPVICGLHG